MRYRLYLRVNRSSSRRQSPSHALYSFTSLRENMELLLSAVFVFITYFVQFAISLVSAVLQLPKFISSAKQRSSTSKYIHTRMYVTVDKRPEAILSSRTALQIISGRHNQSPPAHTPQSKTGTCTYSYMVHAREQSSRVQITRVH